MTRLLLRQEGSDRPPAFPELGLSPSKDPAKKIPKETQDKHGQKAIISVRDKSCCI